MCIQGRPTNTFELAPRQGIFAWRAFEVDKGFLEPAYSAGRQCDLRTWHGRVAKAHGRPTARPHSDVGLHAVKEKPSHPRSGKVVGKVRLFGRVVEHRLGAKVTGYLAEYAEVVGLSLKSSSLPEVELRALAARYKARVLA